MLAHEISKALIDDTGRERDCECPGQGRLAGALRPDETNAPLPVVLTLPVGVHRTMMSCVGQYSYVAILVFVMAGCLWLEIVLRTRVFRRWLRLVLAIAPALVLFAIWDVYAISEGHWWFDEDLILGIHLPGELPLDEVLFFVAIPVASILTFEAVRSVKDHWVVGDGPTSERDVP